MLKDHPDSYSTAEQIYAINLRVLLWRKVDDAIRGYNGDYNAQQNNGKYVLERAIIELAENANLLGSMSLEVAAGGRVSGCCYDINGLFVNWEASTANPDGPTPSDAGTTPAQQPSPENAACAS